MLTKLGALKEIAMEERDRKREREKQRYLHTRKIICENNLRKPVVEAKILTSR